MSFEDRAFQRKQARLDAGLYGLGTSLLSGFATGFWQTEGISYPRLAPAVLLGLVVGIVLYRRHMRTALQVENGVAEVRGLFKKYVFPVSDVRGVSPKDVMHGAACLALELRSGQPRGRRIPVRSWPFERAQDEELRTALGLGEPADGQSG